MEHPDASIDVICEIAQRMRQTNLLVTQRASRNINVEMAEKSTIGQRIADKVASFGGSWTFIIIYLSFLVSWMAFNTFVLVHYGSGPEGKQFDAYPYILLNLMLSMTAALQAPIIMMSQNRAAEKDRLAAEQDFKVNLKSELMLEELSRKQRERDVQMDQLNAALKTLRAAIESQNAQQS
jgi:CRP/FNR family cyclic AMP-dependent transcriptional regulator